MSKERVAPRSGNCDRAVHLGWCDDSIARDTLGGIAALALPWAIVTALAALKAAGIW